MNRELLAQPLGGGRKACPQCGKLNDSDAKHCDQCGAKIGVGVQAQGLGLRWAALIGADQSNHLVVADPQASGIHGVIYTDGQGVQVVDLNSTNGTRVNGLPLNEGSIGIDLTPGESITIGTTKLMASNLRASLSRGARGLLVGRDVECDVVLDLPVVSGKHLLVIQDSQGLRAIDLHSSNGTFLRLPGQTNSKPLTVQAILNDDDALYLGTARIPVAQLKRRLRELRGTAHQGPGEASSPSSIEGQVIPLPPKDQSLSIGRDSACDVVISAPQLSAQHLRITLREGGAFFAEDLGSLNGTFFEGARIVSKALPPRCTLIVGTVPIHLDSQRGTLTIGERRGALRLDALKVSRVVTNRETKAPLTLVDDVSISIYPSELVGLMGPSGAGKTTFMLALNGYEPPSSGQVLINGEDLYANFNAYRGLIGYVPQDDIMHGELTVEEALTYAARLRLPPDTTALEIAQAVDRVIEELSLGPQRHVQIGSPEAKVLSGGQRKRVNLALELVTDPVLLFLDEPTSGLSARDTRDVMEVLRQLADSGRTIIITIHQPSREVYERMDHVIYLAKGGKLAYFGPTAPGSYDYFGVESPSPDDIMNRIRDRTPEEWQGIYRASESHGDYVIKRQAKAADKDALKPEVERRSAPVPQLSQGWTLFQRYVTIKVRDKTNLLFMLAQAPLVGLLLALAFHDAADEYLRRGIPIFILCIAMVFFGCMNACREIVTERGIFRRERMVNLKILPYVMSKFVVLAGIGMLQSALLLAIAQGVIGLEGDTIAYMGVLTLTSVAASALGLLISALVTSAEAAMAAVPILLVFQIVLSGFLIPLKQDGKEYIEVMAAPMIARWSVEGLLDIEREGLEDTENQDPWTLEQMERKDLSPEELPKDVGILLCFTFSYLGLASLRLRQSNSGA